MLLSADDTSLLISQCNFNELASIVNVELKKAIDFFRLHKLALHPSKTKFMVFSNSAEFRSYAFKILMNYINIRPDLITEISKVHVNSKKPAIKFCGVFFEPLLYFEFHLTLI
jgi:hypothetical protein